MDIHSLALHIAGTHYTDKLANEYLDGNATDFCWPEIDAAGFFTGKIIGDEHGYANVNDQYMIKLANAKSGGWIVDDGYATPPKSV